MKGFQALEPYGLCISDAGQETLIATNTPMWAYGLRHLLDQAEPRPLPYRFVDPQTIASQIESRPAQTAADMIRGVSLSQELSMLLRDPVAGLADDDLLNADAPVIRIVNMIIRDAIDRQASDIHFEVYGQKTQIRFRIDGVLADVATPPREIYSACVSRVKIMANLDIAEKRLPQDGRITVRFDAHTVDIRVSTLPTGRGERVALRLLRKESGRVRLDGLGMSSVLLAEFRRLIEMPNGIVLVTGPTGSGKTTTLYAAIESVRTSQENIMTVEDPIEYEIDGVSQTQVQPKIGLTFATALRAILRQDPDVLMIGEIRDVETAQIAVQAALTGHLVLATLHTNDAPSSIARLIDMGIEPFMLSSTINGVLAQRLVRCLCPECRISEGLEGVFQANSLGCPSCKQAGYSGRTGVFELMVNRGELRNSIKHAADANELRELARSQGMPGLLADAQRWIDSGITSTEEVTRVLSFDQLAHD